MGRVSASIPVRKLAAGSDTYKRGYHRGNPGGLDAVETDLATGNIKDSVNIFGKVGTVFEGPDISDADAAVGEVKDGKFFYSVAEPRKEGTMPTVALAPGSDAYPAGYHAGNVGGLVAIDEHFVVANIEKEVVIFGITGTLLSLIAALNDGGLDALGASVGDFQTNPGTGDMTSPDDINNNLTNDNVYANAINKYVEVDYGKIVIIKRWRQYGFGDNVGDGRYKLTYWNLFDAAWEDWVVNIPTRTVNSWSGYSTETPVFTTKIRLICTTVDSQPGNSCRELEVIL